VRGGLDEGDPNLRTSMRRLAVLLAASLLLSLLTAASLVAPTPAGAGGTSFSDVQPSNQFFGHITWLAEEGIAEGFPDGGFHPTAPISRGAMAAFLYRVAGEPTFPDPSTPTFPDVPTNHPFFTEIEWLAAEGITTGFADGTFRSTAATSRQAMAAYLYRFSGEPAFADPSTPTFSDVPTTSQFFTEVEWLVDAQITTGFPDGGFHPVDAVSRQAMAAFVFRQQHQDPTITVDAGFETALFRPWDLVFLPDGQALFTQRNEGLYIRQTDGDVLQLADEGAGDLSDLLATFETGIMGITTDPDFTTNRTFYTCQGEASSGGDPGDVVQLVQWTLAVDSSSATRVSDQLLEMAPWQGQLGRHGGCRPRFGPDGYLWMTAGDTACGRYPQDLTARAGKVLRIDVDPVAGTATAPPDNPFVGVAGDDFVYSYGHRNPQGLAWRPGTDQLWSVEHGPGVDDEVNLLQAGGNYGWHPISTPGSCTYNEGVPMTDVAEFPAAIPAAWDSDGPTIAPSGGTWLEGDSWGGWEGAFVMAVLKDRHVRVQLYTDTGVFIEERLPQLGLPGTPRIRTPRMGPGEDLFLTTDEGSNDRIVRISATP
jgi:glucose/arabinose dehydrogenase